MADQQPATAAGHSTRDFTEALAFSIADMLDAQLGIIGDVPMREPLVDVRKVSGTAQVSTDMLMTAGLIPDDRPPFVPTRRERFRWWRQERLRRARMRLASWIAGFDVEDRW